MVYLTKPVLQIPAEKVIVRESLPAHMLFLMLETLKARGASIRPDFMPNLENAVLANFSKLDELTIARLAKRLDRDARDILREGGIGDATEEGVIAVALMTLKLIEASVLRDKGAIAVLISLQIVDEASKDDVGREMWRWRDGMGEAMAGRMRNRGSALGYW